MKVDIKEVGGKIWVDVPYKNGMVTWQLSLDKFGRPSERWTLYDCPFQYNPVRVQRAHDQFLYGKWLYRRLVKFAAASQRFNMLAKLRDLGSL